MLQNVIEAAESLPELWQVPRVFISSFLPHAIRPKDEVQDSELRQRVKRQTNYNVWVDKWLSKTDGVVEDAYHIIGHGWAWASRRHAKSEFYDLSGSWYGLHLNNDGTERLIQDFLSVLWGIAIPTALFRATTWSKEIIQALVAYSDSWHTLTHTHTTHSAAHKPKSWLSITQVQIWNMRQQSGRNWRINFYSIMMKLNEWWIHKC